MSARLLVVATSLAAMTAGWPAAVADGDNSPDPAAVRLVLGPIQMVAPATPDSGSASPAMAVGPHGSVTAVWRQGYPTADGSTAYRMRVARRSAAGRWSRPHTLACPGVASCASKYPQIGADASGDVTAVWSDSTTVMVVRRLAGEAWGTTQVLGTQHVFPTQIDLAVARNGQAVVAWSSGNRIHVSTRAAGDWTPPVVIRGFGSRPRVAVSERHTAVVVYWRDYSLWASNLAAGRWTGPHRLSGAIDDSAVAMGPRGKALATWTVHEAWVIRGAEMTASGVWGRSQLISDRHHRYLDDAAVPVIDSRGVETVAWVHAGNHWVPRDGMVARRTPGRGWTRAAVTGVKSWHGPMNLVVDARGDLAVGFPDRVMLRPAGGRWSAPAHVAGTLAILPDGSALRMRWTPDGLVAQRIHRR